MRPDTGVTITILPGTTIFFAAHQDDQHQGGEVQEFYEGERDPASTLEYTHSHVEIKGKFVARGTLNNRIVFTSDSLNPNYADWEALYLQPGSTLEYCVVEYGRGCDLFSENIEDDSITVSHSIYRHMFWGAIVPHSCSPKITYNYVYDAGHAGIEVFEGEGSAPTIANNVIAHTRCGIVLFSPRVFPVIENNVLIDNGGTPCISIAYAKEGCGGIVRYNLVASPNGAPHDWVGYEGFVYKAYAPRGEGHRGSGLGITSSSPTVTNNIFFKTGGSGIAIEGSSSPIIRHNTISGAHNGIVIHHYTEGSSQIEKNNIYNNKYDNFRLDNVAYSIIASSNWWGTNDPSEIPQKIHDYYDDPTLGEVNYQPFEMGIVRAESVISISASRPSVTVGDVMTVSGSIGPPHGGAVVTLTYTKPDANVIVRTVTTNFAGRFSDTYIPDQLGSWSVNASWDGDEDYEGAAAPPTSFRIEETPAPTPTPTLTLTLTPTPAPTPTPTPTPTLTPAPTPTPTLTPAPTPTPTPAPPVTEERPPTVTPIPPILMSIIAVGATVIAAMVLGGFWFLKKKK